MRMPNDGPSTSCALRMKHASVGSPSSQSFGFNPLRTSSPSPRISRRAARLISTRRAPKSHQPESPRVLANGTYPMAPNVVLPHSYLRLLWLLLSDHEST